MSIVKVTGGVIKIDKPINTTVQKQKSNDHFTNKLTNSLAKDVSVGSANLNNQSVRETYSRMSGDKEWYRQNVLGIDNVVDESEIHKKTFYDEMSGQSFEYSTIDGTSGLMLDKENYDKICALYPWGTPQHSFKLAEMRGTAKIVNGMPIKMIEALPSGYSIEVYDKDFNWVKSISVPATATELDPDVFFNKLEKFAETHHMEDEFFWEKFLEELME